MYKFRLVKYEDVKHITAEEYFKNNALAVDIFNAKYAFKKNDSIETPADVFWRVASGLAKYEDSSKADYYRDWWFTLMWLGWFRPGGSVLSGVGNPKKVSLINCTHIPLLTDSLGGIIRDCEYKMAKCAAMRQGLGCDLSVLRPKDAPINNAAEISEGVVSWATKLSELGRFVGQRGRMPALLLSLKIDHPDVYDFVVSKTDLKAIVNANISVQITGEFIEAVKNDADWELRFNFKDEGYDPIIKVVKARDLMELIAKTARSTAEPGVQYIDLMRKGSMIHQIFESEGDYRFKIIGTNACCLTKDNLIYTDKGILKVEDLIGRSDVRLLYRGKYYKVKSDGFFSTGKKLVYKVVFDNGSIVTCSIEHKFINTYDRPVELKDINVGDTFFVEDTDNPITKVLSVTELGEAETYTVTVDDVHRYVVNGIETKNSEKPLSAYGGCNLCSPNLEMFSTNRSDYQKELEFVIPLLVRMSDRVIDYEIFEGKCPLKEQEDLLTLTREIGLGMTNLHGWFIKQDLQYDSDEAIDKAEEFFSYYAYQVFKSSMDLGKELGNAPSWDLVSDKSVFMGSVYFKNIVDKYFEGDPTKVTHMRNMAHMSIAPTGSLSLIFPTPTLSTGVEPIFAPCYWKKTRAVKKGVYTHYFTIPSRVREYVLSKIDPDTDDYKKLSECPGSIEDNDGKVGNELKSIITRALPKGFFKAAHEIDPMQKIKMMGRLYKWVDAAISCTYNLPRTATDDDVMKIYMTAYDVGVRAVSVYVDGSREGILLLEDPVTYAKKYEAKLNQVCGSERPVSIVPNCAPKRPKELKCDIHHTSVKGEMFLVMVSIMDGHPFEVFAGPAEDLYLPKSCTNGLIIKEGGGKYSLHVTIRRSPVVYQDLASVLMSDDQKALTRLLSLSLRHGAPPRFIVEQLKKSNGNITAFSTAVARVLSRYIGTYNLTGDESKCPKCGDNSLVFAEGCIKCANDKCGYSRCG